MAITVFTNTDEARSSSSVFLLSVTPIRGGGVSSFAYLSVTRGTYLDNIDAMTSNRQVLHWPEVETIKSGSKRCST